MLQRKKPNRLRLALAHYRIARRYCGRMRAARIAVALAAVA